MGGVSQRKNSYIFLAGFPAKMVDKDLLRAKSNLPTMYYNLTIQYILAVLFVTFSYSLPIVYRVGPGLRAQKDLKQKI